jgi:hypothetical protein
MLHQAEQYYSSIFIEDLRCQVELVVLMLLLIVYDFLDFCILSHA